MLIGARSSMLTAQREYTAADYVQSGLLAMWDGIENVGWNTHETGPSKWRNLVEGSSFPDFNIESGKTFADDHLIVNGLTARSASAWSNSFIVLEQVYRLDSGFAFSTST